MDRPSGWPGGMISGSERGRSLAGIHHASWLRFCIKKWVARARREGQSAAAETRDIGKEQRVAVTPRHCTWDGIPTRNRRATLTAEDIVTPMSRFALGPFHPHSS